MAMRLGASSLGLEREWQRGQRGRGVAMELATLQEVILLITLMPFQNIGRCSQDLCPLTPFSLPWDPGALSVACE